MSTSILCIGLIISAFSCIPINIIGKSVIAKAESSNQEFSFGAIADCQYWNGVDTDSRKYSKSSLKLNESVENFNSQKIDFTIHLGDFIDRSWESFNVASDIFNKLNSPYYHVLGNHDFLVLDDEKDKVSKKLTMPSDYYDFSVKGWRFIVLNGNDISFHAYSKDSEMYKISSAYYKENKIESPKWNGAIGEAQISWLKKVLNNASKRNENVIIFCHFPVFPENIHNLWNADEIINIVDDYSCVKAYVNGHNHDGNYAFKNGVHYLTLKGMVETEQNSYAVIKLNNEYIQVEGYGREENRLLKIQE